MEDDLSATELETLKSRFREAGCKVADLAAPNFEAVFEEFPIRTHVYANPYYVELGTYIFAKPQGFLRARKSKIHKLLNSLNGEADLVKFTVDAEKLDENGYWPIFASVKLVTGIVGGDYDAKALKNVLLLWSQDVAEVIASPEGFELHMISGEDD